MALGDYLASLNLSPGVASKLASYTEPNQSTVPDEFGPPTAEEMKRYGANDADVAAAQRFNGPAAGPTPLAATNPTKADPKWDPDVEAKALDAKRQRDALASATPQGPMGSDGFPTYKDLSQTGPGAGGPVMPARVMPAHWQPGTRGYSRQLGMDPSELQTGEYHRDVAMGQRMLAGDKHLEAAQKQAEADVAYAEAHQQASDQAAARLAQLQEERKAYVLREQERMEELAQAANQKVDPDLARGSSGAQLFAAIGVALGTFGSSMTGGPNTAYDIVKSNIDRNLRAQEVNISNARAALGARQNLYQQNLAEFGDKERAILATKVAMLDQAKAIADQQYAKAKGTANEGAYHDFVARLNDDRAEAADRFAKLTHTQVAEQGNEHYVPATVVGGGGGGMKGKDDLYVPTLGGYARDAETAKKLNEHGAQRMQINEDLREINALLKEAKGLNSVTNYGRMQEIRERIDGLKNGILQRTTVLAGQGAMSNGDKSVAEIRSQLNNIDPQLKTDAAIERAQKGVRAVALSHQRDHRFEGEASGIRLGQERYVQGPAGPEPRAVLQGRNKTVSKETESFDDLVEPPKGKAP